MRRIVIFLLLSIMPYLGHSQGLAQRQWIEKNMVLLRNKDSIVPFLRLDTLHFSLVAAHKYQAFTKAFERYAPITSCGKANLFVYPTSSNKLPGKFRHPNVIVVFDTNLTLLDSVANMADVLLYVPNRDSLAQDYAAQLLFGAIGAQGRLKDSTKFFPLNAGLSSKAGLRLKYTIPAELGLDSNLIYSSIDSIVNSAIRLHAFPGCEILAAKDGKVFFYKAYGYFTYDSILPVKMNDIYDLASVTKIAASAPCLMKLYDQGKLDLYQTLGHYFPWLRFSNKRKILLIDALTHQARLKPWIPFWTHALNSRGELKKKYFSTDSSRRYPLRVADNLYASKKAQRLIRRLIRRSRLLPQKKYKYSDLSFYLYPELVKRLSGEDFQTCLNKNFYIPLGAWHTGFRPYLRFPLNMIAPTEDDSVFRRQQIWGSVHDEGAAMMGGISGHAGLFSNADDLAKLMQMYMNYGIYADRRYISDTTLRRWTSYQFADRGNRRGIVFDKPLLDHPELGTPSPLASPESFGHSGFTGTFTWADPQTGLVFVFLSNRVYPTRKNKNIIHYNVRTNIHSVLYEAIFEAQDNEQGN